MKWGLAVLAAVLCGCSARSTAAPYCDEGGRQVRYAGRFDARAVAVPAQYKPKAVEFRGVWVATVENIDFPKARDAAEFRKEFSRILDDLASINVNTVVFQVRPTNDAFYQSKLNPWSRFLSGREGQGLGDFDPLAWMIQETHKRGMQFHAWMNPYRVIGKTKLSKAEYLKTLAPGNYARKRPDLVLDIPQGNERLLLFNPGEPEAMEFIVSTVAEVVLNYDVDAIHFDDYFYPYSGLSDQDQAAFRKYNPGKLSLEDWRRANVDRVIRSIHEGIAAVNKRQNRQVEFGISPFGIWANRKSHPDGSPTGGKEGYSALYADVRGWVRNGWIDYVVPQIYWHFNHDVAAYACLTDWWCQTVSGTRVKLYIGHGAYQVGSTMDKLELGAQLRYNQEKSQVRGSCLFSYRNIFRPSSDVMRAGVLNTLKNYWKSKARVP